MVLMPLLLALNAGAQTLPTPGGRAVLEPVEEELVQREAARFNGFVLGSLERRKVRVKKLPKAFQEGIRRASLAASREAHENLARFNARAPEADENDLDEMFLAMRDRRVPEFLERFRSRYASAEERVEEADERRRVEGLLKEGHHLEGKTLEGILVGVGVTFSSSGRPLEELFDER